MLFLSPVPFSPFPLPLCFPFSFPNFPLRPFDPSTFKFPIFLAQKANFSFLVRCLCCECMPKGVTNPVGSQNSWGIFFGPALGFPHTRAVFVCAWWGPPLPFLKHNKKEKPFGPPQRFFFRFRVFQTLNPKHETLNPKPETLNPKP